MDARQQFQGSITLQNKNNINPSPSIVVNLRECKYEIFRRVAQEKFRWEALLPQEYYQQQKKLDDAANAGNIREANEPGDGCDNEQQLTSPIQQQSHSDKPNRNLNFNKRFHVYSQQQQQQKQNTQYDDEKNTNTSANTTTTTTYSNSSQNNQNQTQQQLQQQNQQNQVISYQWDILWFDHGGLTPEFLTSMLPWQRVNHFLGMYNIARKNTLGIHLKRFIKEFPKDYKFFPNTWLYPTEFFEINEYYMNKSNKRKQMIKDGEMTEVQSQQNPIVLFICKPEASCQGKGIFIVKRLDDMRLQLNSQLQAQLKQFQEYIQAQEYYDTALMYSNKINSNQQQQNNHQNINNVMSFSVNQDQSQLNTNNQTNGQQNGFSQNGQMIEPPQVVEKQNTFVIQKYMKNPALINGHKFDFRIYVLITSVIDPLSIFMFRDGLVRLASEKYGVNKNIQDMYIHLTNYSLNKKNSNFDGNKHKMTLSECLKGKFTTASDKGTFSKQSEQIWLEIEDIVIKTVITIQPQLQHYYRSSQPKEPDLCYELLGFDIILDYKLRPWLLEVNHLPSFNSDTATDEQVKYELIRDIFNILQLSIDHRKQVFKDMKADQYRQSQQQGCFKLARLNPQNKFKLIYPKAFSGSGSSPAGGASTSESEQYEKYQKKANEIWQMTTGTFRQQNIQSSTKDEKKKKKLIKSRHRKQSQQLQQQTADQIMNDNLAEKQAYSRKQSDTQAVSGDYDDDGKQYTDRYLSDEQRMSQRNNRNEGGQGEDDDDDPHNLRITLLENTDNSKDTRILSDKHATQTDGLGSKNIAHKTFFEKRQNSNIRQNINASNNNKSQTKQNTQRNIFNQRNPNVNNLIRHGVGREEQARDPSQSYGVKSNDQITVGTGEIQSLHLRAEDNNSNLSALADIKISNKREQPLLESIDSSNAHSALSKINDAVLSPGTDIMIKLAQNKETLKYKEYCKALIDEFNQAYYKSTYNPSQLMQSQDRGQNSQLQDNSSRQNPITVPSQGKTLISNFINNQRTNKTEIVTSMSANHYSIVPHNRINNHNAQSLNPIAQQAANHLYKSNFNLTSGTTTSASSSTGNYIKKLKHVIHSQNNRQVQNQGAGNLVGRSNKSNADQGIQGFAIDHVSSPGSNKYAQVYNLQQSQNQQIKLINSKNQLQSSLIRSKEDLALYNLATNQRILIRSDSVYNNNPQIYIGTQNQTINQNIYANNQYPVTVDMASINLSAGIIDFKIQYRKHQSSNKRFNSKNNNSVLSNSYTKNNGNINQPVNSVQATSLAKSSDVNNSKINQKMKLQWINESVDLVNYLTHNEDSSKNKNNDANNQSHFKAKREQKNTKIVTIEQQQNQSDQVNLQRLKQFEEKLLSNFTKTNN